MRSSAAHALHRRLPARPRELRALLFARPSVRRRDDLRAAGECRDLRLARALEVHHEVERSCTVGPHASRPWLRRIIALCAPRSRTSRACSSQVERDAFVVVVADGVGEAHRVLRERQQAVALRRDGESRPSCACA